jgi:LemA protein
MKTFALRIGGLLFALSVLFGLTGCGSYNRLVTLEQNVNKKWADVQSVYQRRADLIPNLVNTVSGAANFEKSTLTEVTNARASVGRVTLDSSKAPTDAAQLQAFQQAQGQLSTALSRLMVVSENYPQLRATEGFQNLQAQLEGTENRISVERNNFNSAVQEYNTALGRFPTNMLNKMFGFQPRPFFTAQAGSETAPSVNFGSFGSSPAAPAAPVPPTSGTMPAPTPPTAPPAATP